MADHGMDEIDPRLQRFFAAEQARAEADFERAPIRPRVDQVRMPVLGFSIVAAILAVAVLATVFALRLTGPGGLRLGSDGVPTSIDGEPVLRGEAIAARLAGTSDGEAFLAGGILVLDSEQCPAAAPSTGSVDCGDGWRLDEDATGSSGPGFPLMTIQGEAGFVHTSGAPTVLRVEVAAAATRCGPMCPDTLLVRATVWRQPTKGPIPDEATPAEGGETNLALVPDFVSYSGMVGETIVGYIAKGDLFGARGPVGGSPSDPPQDPPMLVYGEDLVTVVGQDVPGIGFVAAGATIPPAPSKPLGDPSAGPSGTPGVEFEAGAPVAIDGEPVFAGTDIDLVLAGPGSSFLVTGALGYVSFDCVVGSCPGSAWLLQEPVHDDRGAPGRILLDANGTWAPPSQDRWPGELVVLRVRAYDLECPWENFCEHALLVEAWIAAR